MRALYCFFVCLVFVWRAEGSTLFCDSTFCRTYGFDVGCSTPAQECGINNATHMGIWMLSPTTCNCCEFCLPLYVEGHHCSVGGPGMGTTVGRCGDGLTCVTGSDGLSYCRRMESPCHDEQDDYDERHEAGTVGALESRRVCDGKGLYGLYDCIPTQTCFCQSEEGERIFGEVLNLGEATRQNMHCGCSRLHEKIRTSITAGVAYPVIGPRCTADGNFNPVQCIDRVCYCVDKITGAVSGDTHVNLDEKPLTELNCYDSTLDLFPDQSRGDPPYNYTTPCFESMSERVEFLKQSEQDGYSVEFFSGVPECLPDGTYGRVSADRNGTRICVDQFGVQIEDYHAEPYTQQYEDMNCKCAETSQIMSSSLEGPVCCKNGNFRTIQCRRGFCRCVDADGRQHGTESTDVTTLPCYRENWREIDSEDCYSN